MTATSGSARDAVADRVPRRATTGRPWDERCTSYIVKRVLLVIPTLLGAAALVFILMRLIPGDICVVRLGSGGGSFDPQRGRRCAMPRSASTGR